MEHLTKYRKSMDEIELREKQLAAMRVDVCSTTALKKLKGCCCMLVLRNLYMGIDVVMHFYLPFWISLYAAVAS